MNQKIPAPSPGIDRRRLLALGAAGLALAPFSSAWAQGVPAADLSRVSLRVASYKGGWITLLKAAGLDNTP